MYPKCAHTFRKFLVNNNLQKIYQDLGKPKPFDVTLRDGLQALSKDEQENYKTNNKLDLYYNILFNYKPKNIEIGSIVSEKVLPVFKDTLEIFDTVNKHKKQNNFIVIPSQNKLQSVINNVNIKNFSFITSVSNSFQNKNTKMNLEESDSDILTMLQELHDNKFRKDKAYIKLYVSCINKCPIEGNIDNDFIVNRLLKLNNIMKVDKICLSDTCGTLNDEDFEYIVDTCEYFGLPMNKFSLHLHVQKGKEEEVEKIIYKALDRKITEFDVSLLESGGCSVTMNRNQLASNLSYELYYRALCNYVLNLSLKN
jgi:isopropylmalate/homocitrate/citramalate synthase